MNIRELCEKYNISQSGLARRFGIPLRTVQGWYLGERKPPEYVVGMIDELLQLNASEPDDDEDEDCGYDYSQHLHPDERYRLTKDGPLLTKDEVMEELKVQYLGRHPGASDMEAKLMALTCFRRMERDRAMLRTRAEAIRVQREARQRMIREKDE